MLTVYTCTGDNIYKRAIFRDFSGFPCKL